MKIFDLFSKRLKEENGQVPETYQYDEIPKAVRVQLVHIFFDGLGKNEEFHDSYGNEDVRGIYTQITSILRREYGVFHLTDEMSRDRDTIQELVNFFLQEREIPKVLDVVQLAARAIENITNNWGGRFSGQASNLITELNHRFREAGVGYTYTSGNIIRVDSEFTHSEIVKPALELLASSKLRTVQSEFLAAHQHFRVGEYQDCLADCGSALESMMKIMLDEKGVTGMENTNANALVTAIFEKNIVPKEMQSQFTSLRSVLSSGTPTIRNKFGPHGQGTRPKQISEGLASYCINLTASSLLFLASIR
jgi:hypothetical protein